MMITTTHFCHHHQQCCFYQFGSDSLDWLLEAQWDLCCHHLQSSCCHLAQSWWGGTSAPCDLLEEGNILLSTKPWVSELSLPQSLLFSGFSSSLLILVLLPSCMHWVPSSQDSSLLHASCTEDSIDSEFWAQMYSMVLTLAAHAPSSRCSGFTLWHLRAWQRVGKVRPSLTEQTGLAGSLPHSSHSLSSLSLSVSSLSLLSGALSSRHSGILVHCRCPSRQPHLLHLPSWIKNKNILWCVATLWDHDMLASLCSLCAIVLPSTSQLWRLVFSGSERLHSASLLSGLLHWNSPSSQRQCMHTSFWCLGTDSPWFTVTLLLSWTWEQLLKPIVGNVQIWLYYCLVSRHTLSTAVRDIISFLNMSSWALHCFSSLGMSTEAVEGRRRLLRLSYILWLLRFSSIFSLLLWLSTTLQGFKVAIAVTPGLRVLLKSLLTSCWGRE